MGNFSKTSGNFTADGNSATVTVENGTPVRVVVGSTTSSAFGTGSVSLQVSFDEGTTWFTYDASTDLSAAGNILMSALAFDSQVRLNLNGATAPDLDYIILEGTE